MTVRGPRALGVLVGLALAALAACAEDAGRLCMPGESRACVGAGGCAGGQVCLASGAALGPCDCGVDVATQGDAVSDGESDAVSDTESDATCASCSAHLADPTVPVCAAAAELWEGLKFCAASSCAAACSGLPNDDLTAPACEACLGSSCSFDLSDCRNG